MARSHRGDPREREHEACCAHTSEVLAREQTRLVAPREEVHKQDAHQVREEVDRADDRAPVREARGEAHPSEDRDDLDDTVDAAEERRLQVREAEGGDDERALVRERVGHVVERGEEREEPGLRVRERLVELLHLEVLVLDTGLVFLCR